jgi:cell division protein YceG involved in septum cleavage
MSLKNIIQDDLQSIIAEKANDNLVYRGEEYQCVASGVNNQKSLEAGGYSLEQHNSFTILKSDFTDGIYPKEQEKITYKGVKYRIVECIHEGNDAFIRLICQFENY